MKIIRRIHRWFKCGGHKWQHFEIEDQELTQILLSHNVKIYEKIDATLDHVKICEKCRELRMYGNRHQDYIPIYEGELRASDEYC